MGLPKKCKSGALLTRIWYGAALLLKAAAVAVWNISFDGIFIEFKYVLAIIYCFRNAKLSAYYRN